MSFRWVFAVASLLFVAVFSSVVAQYVQPATMPPAAATPVDVPTVTTPASAIAPAAAPAAPAVPGVAGAPAVPATPAAPAKPPAALAPSAPSAAAAPNASDPALPSPARTPSSKSRSNSRPTPYPSPVSEPQMLVLQLRSADARSIHEILRSLLSPPEFDAVRLTPDPQTNSLILRGQPKDIERVRNLVEQLDRRQTPVSPNFAGQEEEAVLVPRYAPAPAMMPWPLPNRFDASRMPSGAESKLLQEYAKIEGSSLEVAKQYRQAAQTLGADHPQQKQRREEISNIVGKAFDTRQLLQNLELKQLHERIAKVEQSLTKRQKNRDQIIAKRVNDLLEDNRDLDWNAANLPNGALGYNLAIARIPTVAQPHVSQPPANTSVYPGLPAPAQIPNQTAVGGRTPIRTTIPNALTPAPAQDPYGAQPEQQSADPFAAQPGQPGTDPLASPGNKQSAAPIESSQPAGALQRQALEAAQEQLIREEALVAAWKKKQLSESDLQSNPEYQQALRELEFAKRQLDHAQRESDTVRRLLMLDLEAAQVEHQAAREALTTAMQARPARSQVDINRLQTAVRQAEVRLQRAQTLLDHHSRITESTPKDSEPAGTTKTTEPTRK